MGFPEICRPVAMKFTQGGSTLFLVIYIVQLYKEDYASLEICWPVALPELSER